MAIKSYLRLKTNLNLILISEIKHKTSPLGPPSVLKEGSHDQMLDQIAVSESKFNKTRRQDFKILGL